MFSDLSIKMLSLRLPPSTPETKQIYAACGPILLHFSHAYMIGVQLMMLLDSKESGGSISLTTSQQSWIVTTTLLMLISSQCLGGMLTSKYGRKTIICSSILPNILACIITGCSYNFTTIFIASIISGIVGAGISLGSIFIVETCSKELRAIALNLRMAFYCAGFALAVLFGNFFNWRTIAFYGCIPNVMSLVFSLTVPESPVWFASKEKYDDFKYSFLWYRGDNDTEESEQVIETKLDNFRKNKVKGMALKNIIVESISDIGFLKAICISFLSILIYNVSGKQIFTTYAIDLITSATDFNNLHYYYFAIYIVDFISLCVSCIFLSQYERRNTLFIFAIPSLFMLLVFCLLTFVASKGHIPTNLNWIPLIFMSLYFVFLNLGVLPVLFALITEVYSLSSRSLGVVITSLMFIILQSSVSKLTPCLEIHLGIHGVFSLIAGIISLSLICLYLIVPETSDQTMLEISKRLKYNVIIDEDFDIETQGIIHNLELREKILASPYPIHKFSYSRLNI